MEREVKAAARRQREAETERDVARLELASQRERCEEAEQRFRDKEDELTYQRRGRVAASSDILPDQEQEGEVSNLQTQLKRLAADQTEKDRRMTRLETELREQQEYIEELERHLDQQTIANCKDKVECDRERRKEERTNMIDFNHNIQNGGVQRTDTHTTQSTICVVM